jgi:signal peptidase II
LSTSDPIKISANTIGRARQALAFPVLLATVVVVFDQLSKWAVARELGPSRENHRSEIVGDVLGFQYVENSGAAFGMFRGQTVVLTVVAFIVVAALIFSYRRAQHTTWQLTAGLGLLLGGAIGNLVDRIRLGYVVDFIAVSVWPKFNVADSAITIGVLLITWHALANDFSSESKVVLVSRNALDRDTAP